MAQRHGFGILTGAAVLGSSIVMGAASAFAATYTAPPINLGTISAPKAPASCHGRSGWYCHPAPGSGTGSQGSGGTQTGPGTSGGSGGSNPGTVTGGGSPGTTGNGNPGPSGPPAASTGGSGSTVAGSAGLSAQEARVLSLVNQSRTAGGLSALQINPTLQTLALKKADDMVTLHYFGHVSPDLGLPAQMETAAGYLAQAMGAEDIAEAGSVLQAFAMFRGSPTHWANIMYPSFTQIGIAVVPNQNSLIVELLFSGNPVG